MLLDPFQGSLVSCKDGVQTCALCSDFPPEVSPVVRAGIGGSGLYPWGGPNHHSPAGRAEPGFTNFPPLTSLEYAQLFRGEAYSPIAVVYRAFGNYNLDCAVRFAIHGYNEVVVVVKLSAQLA